MYMDGNVFRTLNGVARTTASITRDFRAGSHAINAQP
jgi:hypothetical protein